MKKLLTTMMVLLSVVALAQKPKYIIVKNYREGKLTAQKKVELPTQTKVIYKYITVVKTKKVEVPVPKIEYKIVEVAGKPTALDTVSILQAYYPKNAFKDVLVLPEGQGRVTISDTISHNRLASRKWVADITPKVVKETVEVPAPAIREYYLGPEASTNFRSINNWYSINVLVKNKSNNIIKLGGGINMRDGIDGPQPYLAAGFYFKIK
jgi:hypothetical protein